MESEQHESSEEEEKNSDEERQIKKIFGDDWFGKPGVSSSSSETEELPEEKKIKTKHPEYVTFDEATGKYSCGVCSRTFKRKKQARYHFFCGKEEKPFKCKLCGRLFISRSHFLYHLQTHSGEKPFGCRFCNCCFRQKDKLKRHEKIHVEKESRNEQKRDHTKRHLCSSCPKTYADAASLRRHIASQHTTAGHRCFMCDRCGRVFSRAATLHIHAAVHTGQRSHACNQCDKRFKNRKELTRHRHIHEEDLSFSCELCQVRFRRRDNLKRHIRNAHPDGQKTSVIVKSNFVQASIQQFVRMPEQLVSQASVIRHTDTLKRESVIKTIY